MQSEAVDAFAKRTAQQLQSVEDAKAVLATQPKFPFMAVLNLLSLSLALWVLLSSGLSAGVMALVAASFVGVLAVAVEQWVLRRRLEAAIRLLLEARD